MYIIVDEWSHPSHRAGSNIGAMKAFFIYHMGKKIELDGVIDVMGDQLTIRAVRQNILRLSKELSVPIRTKSTGMGDGMFIRFAKPRNLCKQ